MQNWLGVLFLSTYKSKEAIGNHGLSLTDSTTISCKKTGAFARFHDSYNGNPSIYLSECKVKWQDLIITTEPTDVFSLILNIKEQNKVRLAEKKSKYGLIEHELTREFLFLYAMSMLAR